MRRARLTMRFTRQDASSLCALCYRTLDDEENSYCRATDACISRQIDVQKRWRASRGAWTRSSED